VSTPAAEATLRLPRWFTPGAAARWPGLVAAGVLLAGYALTMAHGLMWFDTGELALVGATWGLGHPPGQPLYTLILNGCARLPGLDPLVGMNLFSALCGAACALPVDALLRRLTGLHAGPRLTVLLAIGALNPIWTQATHIEVYALATLLALLLAAGGARVIRSGGGLAAWAGLGALAGLLAGVNPVFALGAAGGVGVCGLLAIRPWRRLVARGAAATVAGLAVVAATYVYAWQVHRDTATLIWGPLDTVGDWVRYLSGVDYSMTEHGAWGKVPGHVLEWATWLVGQGALPLVALGVAGWAVGSARGGTRAAGVSGLRALWVMPLLTGVAFTFTYGTYYPEVPDYTGYLLPALWLGAVGLGALLRWMAPRRAAIAGGVLALTALATGERPVWSRALGGLDLPHTLAAAWLDAAPPRALLLVESDHLVFPLHYLQTAEGRRPDVVVFNVGFGASSWYWRWQRAQHPDLPEVPPAPNTPARLRGLIDATPDRPVIAETIAWAFYLKLPPCPATWGFGLGAGCAGLVDDPAALPALMQAALDGPAAEEPISFRVVASVAWRRAEGLWVLGDASGALVALRSGIAGGGDLPVPPGLRRPPQAPPLVGDAPILLGHPERNQALGVQALRLLGHDRDAAAWQRGL